MASIVDNAENKNPDIRLFELLHKSVVQHDVEPPVPNNEADTSVQNVAQDLEVDEIPAIEVTTFCNLKKIIKYKYFFMIILFWLLRSRFVNLYTSF
jgi:hypothetical protein